jgi:hypothetical protein
MRSFRDALNSKGEPLNATQPSNLRVASQLATLSPVNPSQTAGAMPGAQSTTLSSAVSELDDGLDGLPKKSKKGLLLGALAAAAVVLVAGMAMKKSPTPPAVTPPKAVVAIPSPPPKTEPTPPPPAQVSLHFEAEPTMAHVFRKAANAEQPEDLGQVPLDLSLPKGASSVEYILRADGYKDRVVRVDSSRDRSLNLSLERVVQAEKKTKVPDKKVPPKAPRRPAIHDADGLAVPSF